MILLKQIESTKLLKAIKLSYIASILCTTLFLSISCSAQSKNGQILVKGGTYTLGDNTHHAIYDAEVADFYIDSTEVTNQQFADVYNWALENNQLFIAQFNGSEENTSSVEFFQSGLRTIDSDHLICLREDYPWPMFDEWKESCHVKYKEGKFIVDPGYEGYPIVEVPWYGAAAYCNFRSLMDNLTPVYETEFWDRDKDATGYRMPTNEEWEWAARGGEKSKGFPFSGGETAKDVAWYVENSNGTTQQVGQKLPNELGLYDMSGNVWEFCTEKEGKFKGVLGGAGVYLSYRLWRGGSFATKDISVHFFRQHIDYPGYNYGYAEVGFRTVRPKK